jgi:hypothetical protein
MLFGNKRRAMASSGGSVGVPAQVSVSGLAGDAAAVCSHPRPSLEVVLGHRHSMREPTREKAAVSHPCSFL